MKTYIAKLSGGFHGKVSQARYSVDVGHKVTEKVPGDLDGMNDWFEPDDEIIADAEVIGTVLPEDFPNRELLVSNKLDTIEAVAAFGDLTKIKGIGKAGAKAITDAI